MSGASTLIAPVFGDIDDHIERQLDIEGYNKRSIYNVPGYKPVKTELSLVPVRVSGRIPADLNGAYLRNGTNTQFDTTHVRSHAFNGAGMLHQVQIRNGAATYSNTYIRTPRFMIEQAMGREVYPAVTDATGGGRVTIEKMKLIEEKKGRGLVPNLSGLEATPASTAVQYHAGRIYCLQETGYAFVLHPKLVSGHLVLDGTGHLETWNGAWRAPFSAHPRIDPSNGDFYSLTTDSSGNVYFGHVTNGALRIFTCIHEHPPGQPRMAWVHDYFLTENYVVFPDISIRFSEQGLLGQHGSCFRFDPAHKLRWGVIPRNCQAGERAKWFETSNAGSIWHVVNAWEEKSDSGSAQIVLYAPMFHDYPADLPIHTPEEPLAKLNKWVLDLDQGRVIEDRILIEHGYERPSVNLAYVGKKSRYGYLIDEREGYMGKGVLKYDLLAEEEAKYFDYGQFFGGEALFVPRAGSVAEDDGYLLELLMSDTQAALLILDARSMEEIGRLHLPQRVPFGVHACWLDDQKLKELIV